MFHSLRARLMVSYVLLILLTLCIAGAGGLLLLQDNQRGILNQRLLDTLGPAALQARTSLARGVAPAQLAVEIQAQINPGWRVLFLDEQGAILADSANELVGLRVPRLAALQNRGRLPFLAGRQKVGERDLMFVASPVQQTPSGRTFLVLAAVLRPVLNGIEELAAPFLLAGIVALLTAMLLAYLLARSIARPLRELTRATEAIARNHYDTQIPVRGDDEVGRLAASFNAMTRAVQQSHRSQKDFVANVSHELKTPLTTIQGFAQAILDGATRDLDGAQYAAQTIYAEAQRMARLVADLLTLARLDAGDVPMEQQTLQLAEIMPIWLERFHTRARNENITLTHAITSPPPILGDAQRLEQVVNNLVDNALKYNHPGGTVHVTLDRDDHFTAAGVKASAARSYARLCVQNTGPGIPRAAQARLFERFYRADPARTAGGSGLGLAIVQEIVRTHHGEIRVHSEPGQGATFCLWLPAVSS